MMNRTSALAVQALEGASNLPVPAAVEEPIGGVEQPAFLVNDVAAQAGDVFARRAREGGTIEGMQRRAHGLHQFASVFVIGEQCMNHVAVHGIEPGQQNLLLLAMVDAVDEVDEEVHQRAQLARRWWRTCLGEIGPCRQQKQGVVNQRVLLPKHVGRVTGHCAPECV